MAAAIPADKSLIPVTYANHGVICIKGCPAGYIPGEACTEDSSFVKECIDPDTWCRGNGYNVTSCTLPKYLSGKCPHSSTLYKSCETDNARACQDAGYASSCEVGKIGDRACPYDSKYKTCVCNPCAGLPIPQHKLRRRVTSQVKSVTPAAQLNINGRKTLCDGFKTCDCGGATGAKTLERHGQKSLIPARNAATRRSINMILQTVLEAISWQVTLAAGSMINVEAPCGSEYVYNESNCPSDKNFHCSNPCGDKYRDCKQLLFTGKTVYKKRNDLCVKRK